MNVIARPPAPEAWTLDSFLAWEREQEGKFEFDGKQPIEMNGGTLWHQMVLSQLFIALWTRLDRSRFIVLSSGLKVLANGRVRYPDVLVLDRPHATSGDIVDAPLFVAEVLSPSTERTDLLAKSAEYGAVPSILHYVILEQTPSPAMVWNRDSAPWTAGIAHTELSLPGLGITVPLDEIYDGVPASIGPTSPPPASSPR